MSKMGMLLWYDQEIAIARHNKRRLRAMVLSIKKFLLERR